MVDGPALEDRRLWRDRQDGDGIGLRQNYGGQGGESLEKISKPAKVEV